jgi:hypothetical protein
VGVWLGECVCAWLGELADEWVCVGGVWVSMSAGVRAWVGR